MAADYDHTGAFRGASFTGADFTGAKFRDCDLRQAKITDSWLVDLSLSGLVGNLVVNDVNVTAFVEGELDKRHPERVQLREVRTADDHRAMWDRIERLWAETVARAGRLPEPALHQRVDGEWSFVETLRHLVFATDRWAGYMILNKPRPYHPLGLPQPGFTPADAAALGIDLDARPPLAEVLEARGTRVALVRGIVDGLTDDDLERECPRLPAPGYPEETYTLGRCLRVIMKEECEHRRYAVRDLAALEAVLRVQQRVADNASLLIASGADVKTVQARLRHAAAKTTLDTYGHLWPDRDESTRAAVEVVFADRADSLRTTAAQ